MNNLIELKNIAAAASAFHNAAYLRYCDECRTADAAFKATATYQNPCAVDNIYTAADAAWVVADAAEDAVVAAWAAIDAAVAAEAAAAATGGESLIAR